MKRFRLQKRIRFKKRLISFLGSLILLLTFFPLSSEAFDFELYDFDFYLPVITIEPTVLDFEHIFTDYSLFTGIKIDNLEGQQLSLELGFDPDLGLDLTAGELLQPGFLLLDGTLAVTVTPTDAASGRAAIRTRYRMTVDPRTLGRDQIRARIRAQLGRDSGRIGARARLADARLMRFVEGDNGGTWIRATDAIRDIGRAQIRNMGNSEPDGILGHHGYNEANSYVWAVLDTNSKYAVGVNLDHDNDGVVNTLDNCPYVANTDQINTDSDQFGDACDNDDDEDNILDVNDNCPLFANTEQSDFDGDLIGDACDFDDDNDNVNDGLDTCVYTDPGAVVNDEGCSIADLCGCLTTWKNHGAYVRCVAHTTGDFVGDGLITESEKDYIVSVAAESSCGQK